MNQHQDFDLLMTAWMEADAPRREPDGLVDAVLAQTATTRRRPAWVFPERWLPMQLTIPRPYIPRTAWILVVVALAVALAFAAIIVVGSRHRVPAPFGFAGNGLVAFDGGGQIYAQNADGTGQPQLITTSKAISRPNDR